MKNVNPLAEGDLRVNEEIYKFNGKDFQIDLSHIKRIRKPKEGDHIEILLCSSFAWHKLTDELKNKITEHCEFDAENTAEVCIQPVCLKPVFDELTKP